MSRKREAIMNRDIRFGEVIYSIFHNWRKGLLCIVVFVLLSAVMSYGISFIKEKRAISFNAAADNSTATEFQYKELSSDDETRILNELNAMSNDELLSHMTNEQISAVKKAVVSVNIAQNILASANVSISTLDIPTIDMTYYISSSSYELSSQLVDLYCASIKPEIYRQYFTPYVGDPWSYSSLIKAYPNGSDSTSFTISLQGPDVNILNIYADAMESFINSKFSQYQTQIGTHQLKKLDRTFGLVNDIDFYRNVQNELNEADMNIGLWAYTVQYFNTYQCIYYNRQTSTYPLEVILDESTKMNYRELIEMPVVIQKMKVITAHINIKYVLVGFILGIFAFISYYILRVFFSEAITYRDPLDEIFEIPLISRIPHSINKKRLLSFLDTFIERTRYRHSVPIQKECIDICASAISQMYSEESTFAIVDITATEKSKSVIDSLVNAFKNSKITVESIKNAEFNKAAFDKLTTHKKVILVCQSESTTFTDVFDALQMLNHLQIACDGIILIES